MSKIEWTDRVWNPVLGCKRVSPGCTHCYAETQAHRGMSDRHKGLTVVQSGGRGPRWTGEVRTVPEVLEVPMRRRKPAKYFVNSMSDLFHEKLVGTEEGRRFIAAVFGVMAACPQHTFQVLTKRPEQACKWLAWVSAEACSHMAGVFESAIVEHCVYEANTHLHAAKSKGAAKTILDRWRWATQREYGFEDVDEADARRISQLIVRLEADPASKIDEDAWLPPNVWLGVSVEDQKRADERIPLLMQLPAAVRFLSVEPLLGAVDLNLDDIGHRDDEGRMVDWVIVGGESGRRPRPMHPRWARTIRDDCELLGIPFFFKQWGAWGPGMGHQKDRAWVDEFGNTFEPNSMFKPPPDDLIWMNKAGKRHTGRELDGRVHDEMPTAESDYFGDPVSEGAT